MLRQFQGDALQHSDGHQLDPKNAPGCVMGCDPKACWSTCGESGWDIKFCYHLPERHEFVHLALGLPPLFPQFWIPYHELSSLPWFCIFLSFHDPQLLEKIEERSDMPLIGTDPTRTIFRMSLTPNDMTWSTDTACPHRPLGKEFLWPQGKVSNYHDSWPVLKTISMRFAPQPARNVCSSPSKRDLHKMWSDHARTSNQTTNAPTTCLFSNFF